MKKKFSQLQFFVYVCVCVVPNQATEKVVNKKARQLFTVNLVLCVLE